MSINKAILVGNVGNDPEIKNIGNGKPKASFSLATSERWTDKTSGEKKEKTCWHRIVVFNEVLCRVVEHYVKKGSKLYIEGSIQTREWESEGQKKYITEIVLQGFDAKIDLLDRKEGGGGSGSSGSDDYGTTRTRPGSDRSQGQSSGGYSGGGNLDDDIPFMMEWR